MNNFELLNEQFEIRKQFEDALNRIKQDSEKRKKVDLWETIQAVDKGRVFFEVYSPEAWVDKIKVDMLYYEQFLQKLDSDVVQKVESIVVPLYKNIHDIYEFVNIQPEVYGKDVSVNILNETTEKCKQKLSSIIFEYLDKNFYSLDVETRYKRYYDDCKEIIKQLVAEGVDIEEAIPYSVKVILIENFLGKVAFPFGVWARIKYLSESEEYGKLFDQDKLVKLLENYQSNLRKVSRILAAAV